MQPDSPYCTKASDIIWQQDTPSSVEFDDSYWSQGDPSEEKQWVFPGQHQLPSRAQQADLIVLLELGFGFGHNFLQTIALWEQSNSTAQLHYIAIERSPPTLAALKRVHALTKTAASKRLLEIYPAGLAAWHVVWFTDQIRLTLIFEDAQTALPRLDAKVDVFYLDGFKPSQNPELFNQFIFEGMRRLAQPGASASTYSVAGVVKQGLRAAGFRIEKRQGWGRKRELLFAEAPGDWRGQRLRRPSVQIIGAGIAGQSLAGSLNRFDIQPIILADPNHPGASSQPALNIYPQLSLQRDRLSEFSIAGCYFALHNQEGVQRRPLRWRSATPAKIQRMQRLSQLFPDDYLEQIDNEVTYHQAGIWQSLSPAGLQDAKICELRPSKGQMRLYDAAGHALSQADVTLLAAGTGMHTLTSLALKNVRGQSIRIQSKHALPEFLTGDINITHLDGHDFLVGSTYELGSNDSQTRLLDTDRLMSDLAQTLQHRDFTLTSAHAGIRTTFSDRVIGAGLLPTDALTTAIMDQGVGQHLEPMPACYALMGLGSHGATHAPLAAEAIVSAFCGAPSPLPRDLAHLIRLDRF